MVVRLCVIHVGSTDISPSNLSSVVGFGIFKFKIFFGISIVVSFGHISFGPGFSI